MEVLSRAIARNIRHWLGLGFADRDLMEILRSLETQLDTLRDRAQADYREIDKRLDRLEQTYGHFLNSNEAIGERLNLIQTTAEHRRRENAALARRIFNRIKDVEAIALKIKECSIER
ncbi:hypothetical protein [Pseudanabaena sp. PCC 6802]|uniref:hypothetical protein n=1 Tax=Pseudanabaena sp. PCC 6802 TaxID=118173 RepID=UPI000346CCE0|nr:hypothetical protein [Pseudanabaena sp. PCC 6802]